MKTRCKFQLQAIETSCYSSQKKYTFQANYDSSIPEDQRFAKSSPSGTFTIYVDNPAVDEMFTLGGYYYFDVTSIKAVPADSPST